MEPSDLVDSLILAGGIEPAAVNESGEILYSFTPKLKEISPSLYQEIQDMFSATVMKLWNEGFVDMYDQDGELMVSMNDDTLIKDRSGLSLHENSVLDNLIRNLQ